MEKQHLTYFKIENFKRFDSFEMSNLGQFNLIVGDNNVGKTSVLEALLFDEDIVVLATHYLVAALARKDFSDRLNLLAIARRIHLWNTIFNEIDRPIIIILSHTQKVSFQVSLRPHNSLTEEEKNKIRNGLFVTIPKFWLKLSNEFDFQMINAYFENDSSSESQIPFMYANQGAGVKLVDLFYNHFNSNKEKRNELEKNIQQFIPDLEELRVHKLDDEVEVLSLQSYNEKELVPLSRYGDGTVKYIGVIMDILSFQDKRLMVDEIGSGIHFTRLKDYWKTIIQLCVKYNVQLFSTTHSLECQQAFVEALEDPEMQQYQKDARNITLLENKQGEVKAFTYSFDEFEFSLANSINTRGGER